MSKLILLDVDGVMTNGTKTYDNDGKVISKAFCDYDFTAIKLFQMNDWMVVWLSGDCCVNELLARERNIEFRHARMADGTIDKVTWYHRLVEEYDALPQDVIYVGDDLLDIPIMNVVVQGGGRIYCPSLATPRVRALRDIAVLPAAGGAGAVMALFDLLYPMNADIPCH